MFDNLVKSQISLPLAGGDKGEGDFELFTTPSIFIDIACFSLYIIKI